MGVKITDWRTEAARPAAWADPSLVSAVRWLRHYEDELRHARLVGDGEAAHRLVRYIADARATVRAEVRAATAERRAALDW